MSPLWVDIFGSECSDLAAANESLNKQTQYKYGLNKLWLAIWTGSAAQFELNRWHVKHSCWMKLLRLTHSFASGSIRQNIGIQIEQLTCPTKVSNYEACACNAISKQRLELINMLNTKILWTMISTKYDLLCEQVMLCSTSWTGDMSSVFGWACLGQNVQTCQRQMKA
jgi:hypothetical protein